MPLTKSARKALRGSLRKRSHNLRRSRAMKDAIKTARRSPTGREAVVALSAAYQAIDKAAKRGIIKKNAAARKKSRLAKALLA